MKRFLSSFLFLLFFASAASAITENVPHWYLPKWNIFKPAEVEAWNYSHDFNSEKWRPEIYFKDPYNPGAQVGREGDLALFAGRKPSDDKIIDVLCPAPSLQNDGKVEVYPPKIKSFTNNDVVCSYSTSSGNVFDFTYRKSYWQERENEYRIKTEKKFFGLDILEKHNEAWKKNTEKFYVDLAKKVDADIEAASTNTSYTLSNVFTGIITLDTNYALGTDEESRLILHPKVHEHLSAETLSQLNLTQLGMIWDVSVTIWDVMLNFALTLGLIGMAYGGLAKPLFVGYTNENSGFSDELSKAWASSRGLMASIAMVGLMVPIFPQNLEKAGEEVDQSASVFQYAVQFSVQTGNMIANKLALELDKVVQQNLISGVKDAHLNQNESFFKAIQYDIPLWITAVDDHRICLIARDDTWLNSTAAPLPKYPSGGRLTYEACRDAEQKVNMRWKTIRSNVLTYVDMLATQQNEHFKDGMYKMWTQSSLERREAGWWQIVTNFPASSILATKYIANWNELKKVQEIDHHAKFMKRGSLHINEDEVRGFVPDQQLVERESQMRQISKNMSEEDIFDQGIKILTSAAIWHVVPGFTGFQNAIASTIEAGVSAGVKGTSKIGETMRQGGMLALGTTGWSGWGAVISGLTIAAGVLIEWVAGMTPVIAKIIAMITAMEVFDQLLEAVIVTVLIIAMVMKIMLWVLQLAVTILVSPMVVFYSYYIKEKEVITSFLSRTMFVTLLYPGLIVIGGTLAWAGIFLIDMIYGIIFGSSLKGLTTAVETAAMTGEMGGIENFAQTVIFYTIGTILLKIVKIVWVVYIVFRLPTWLEKQLGMDRSMDISNWNLNDVQRGMRA